MGQEDEAWVFASSPLVDVGLVVIPIECILMNPPFGWEDEAWVVASSPLVDVGYPKDVVTIAISKMSSRSKLRLTES